MTRIPRKASHLIAAWLLCLMLCVCTALGWQALTASATEEVSGDQSAYTAGGDDPAMQDSSQQEPGDPELPEADDVSGGQPAGEGPALEDGDPALEGETSTQAPTADETTVGDPQATDDATAPVTTPDEQPAAEEPQAPATHDITLEAETTFAWFDNGTVDGEPNPEDPNSVRATTKVSATLPAGTVIAGVDAGTDLSGLTLKARLYGAYDSDFSYAYYQDLLEQHIAWHASLMEPADAGSADVAEINPKAEVDATDATDATDTVDAASVEGTSESEVSTSPSVTLGTVQIWRVWLEDATGAELDVTLPAWAQARVIVDYLKAADGSNAYPTAPTGEVSAICTGVADLETLDMTDTAVLQATFETVADPDPLDVISEEGSATHLGDTFGRITYVVGADEWGASAWGDATALYTMEPVQPQQSGADDAVTLEGDAQPDEATEAGGASSGEVTGALAGSSAAHDGGASSGSTDAPHADATNAANGDAAVSATNSENASLSLGGDAENAMDAAGLLVSEPQTLTAYDNGTTTGQLTAEGVAPTARVDVTLPAGTTITGAAEGTDLAGLTLRAQLYVGGEDGFDLAYYQSLVDQHMAWHASASTEEGEASQAEVADVQYWRVWLEDAAGTVVGVNLPAGEKAAVTVAYLPGADGSYAGALSGDVPVVCTGAIDLGKLGTAPETADATLAASSLEATFEALDANEPESDEASVDDAVDATADDAGAATFAATAFTARVVEAAAYSADEGVDVTDGSETVGSATDANTDVSGSNTIARVTYYLTSDTDGTSSWNDVVALVSTKAAPQNLDGGQGDQSGVPMVAGLENVPQDVLNDLAKQGIYPGSKSENGEGNEVWTAFDTGNETTALVKTTVTLPAGTSAAADHYLYIRPVTQGEGYYPKDDALKAVAGETNDVQCYAIHWVHIYQEDGVWKYDLQTDSVLGEDVVATVGIEYLNQSVYLKGHQAERKLQVYNSRQSDGSVLEENATPTGVTANDDAYTGFTFETHRGGPYVFVSKKLFEGYVRSLTVDKTVDGTAPFDGNDGEGNDSGNANGIIRSYDLITYDLTANFGARSSVTTATSGRLYFEMTLNADLTEAVIDESLMEKIKERTVEYLDADGNMLYRRVSGGDLLDTDGNKVSLNDIISGSEEGNNSYITPVVTQRLTGYIDVSAEQNLLSGNQTLAAGIQVLAAHNGTEIKPTFKAWFEGNEDNYGSESPGEGSGVVLAEKVTANTTISADIKVSAAACFNLELAKNNNMSYRGWFDSSTGKEVNSANTDTYTVGGVQVTGAQLYELLEHLGNLAENQDKANPQEFTDNDGACSAYLNGAALGEYANVFGNIRYGRITGYGTTLQVYNRQTASGEYKGFKGVSLPQGVIEFDLDLNTLVKDVDASEDDPGASNSQYYAQLWEYNENANEGKGNQGKNMYWALLASTQYAAWAAPFNSGANDSGCYDGGSWKLGDDGSYHFTVSGYDFNFQTSGLSFPTHKAGNSDPSTGYDSYVGSFSAGYVQVLNVFPRNQSKTLNLNTSVTVKNLSVTTVDGQSVSPSLEDGTGYAHETNTGDNMVNDNIPLYAKGGMTKANAFCDAYVFDNPEQNFTDSSHFLGTDFWGTSYDCSGFAGQRVTLVGAARINAGDYQIKHMNMLQLFDSKVLSLSKNADGSYMKPYVTSKVAGHVEGTTTILYAADPDYRDGYDTNLDGVMAYMSTVREEDLIYFNSVEDLEAAGYTCVGVMAELRDWSINGEGGYSTVLKIPMDVSDDEANLAKTVGTVNTVRMWTNTDDMKTSDGKLVSWANGTYDSSTMKNSVDGYTQVNSGSSEHYSGEVANGTAYQKTEYANGQVVLGSNTGGYVYGSSLLILSYKSEVGITVEQTGGSGGSARPTYDMDLGANIVDYRINSIVARPGDSIGSPQEKKTDLTVQVKLDTARPAEQTEQRIAVSEGTYAMAPASELMVLVDESGHPLDEQSVAIGSDPVHPTTVRYQFKDENTGELTGPIYAIQVHAQRSASGDQVTFEIENVTLGVGVPDITFDALIAPEAVSNGDTISTSASIKGTDDVRAYSETEGNKDTVDIGIVKLAATRLVKTVDRSLVELDDTFTYTVRYTNAGNDPVSVYLYDLLPNTEDIRDSEFNGNVVLREITAQLKGNDELSATINFYYSKTDYATLYDEVKKFGGNSDGTGKNTEAIIQMLEDPNGHFKPLGTINGAEGSELKTSEYIKETFKDPTTGEIDAGKLTEEMSQVTGIYAVVSNLKGGSSLAIQMTVQAQDNKAGDLYRNIANSWLGKTDEPLTSNRVETSVLARAINGVVWEDADLDGVRDEGETLISGVTCTLFAWDDASNKYVKCTKDVTGAEIEPITTGDNGAYSFEKLPAGKYIVAFSGDALKDYAGATVYQVADGASTMNNDAVALDKTRTSADTEVTAIAGITSGDYPYAIAYDLTGDGKEKTANPAVLHTIDEITGNNIALTNSVELHANLDCGLVRAGFYELPETGGSGTRDFAIAGTALVVGVIGGLALIRRRDTRLDVW